VELLSQVQIVQLVFWFLALLELIMGLYVLLLNAWHTTNRHVSLSMFLLAAESLATSLLVQSVTAQEARIPVILLAITSFGIQSILLLTGILLIKPAWVQVRGARRWFWGLFYVLAALPAVLTFIDLTSGTRLFFTGLDPARYIGGIPITADYINGSLAAPMRVINLMVIPLLTMLVLAFLALFDKGLARNSRRLAGVLFLAQALAAFVQLGTANFLGAELRLLLTALLLTLAYAAATFTQLVSERRLQRGSVQVRLTLLILAISLPVLASVNIFLTSRARAMLENEALQTINLTGSSLASSSSIWLNSNVNLLYDLASRPEILTMDPVVQKPLLESTARIYAQLHLISTVDMLGRNIARNDNADPMNFSNDRWFLSARDGSSTNYETLIDRTSKVPALVVSVPIREPVQKTVLGAAMFSVNLDSIARQVKALEIGRGGYSYVLDQEDVVIAHPDPNYTRSLTDMTDYPPVSAARSGLTGNYRFIDENGNAWRANITALPNQWLVIVQVPEAELLAPISTLNSISWLGLVGSSLLLLFLSFLTIRQSMRPVRSLTDTAAAISRGDLTRLAPVESEDEFGVLARAFNSMINQLHELITGLEQRVASRTQDLERSLIQLQVTAEVARDSAAIHDLETLLESTARLISNRFSYYHAGIFLLDENRQFAVLRAASSEGGARMLARGHKLRVGQVGIVGYTAAQGKSRIALDVGSDAVFFDNPDLPHTRSEAALPLIARGQVIGVLDVQSTESGAFKTEDLDVLQVLADQVALAIENARLLDESRRSLQEIETLYGAQTQKAWKDQLLASTPAQYFDLRGVRPISPEEIPSTLKDDPNLLHVPIELRGQRLGWLRLKREAGSEPWTDQDRELAARTAAQAALALENARLMDAGRRRAEGERLVGKIAAQTQGSLNLEAVMRTAVQEIGRAIRVARVRIRLEDTPSEPAQENHNGSNGHHEE